MVDLYLYIILVNIIKDLVYVICHSGGGHCLSSEAFQFIRHRRDCVLCIYIHVCNDCSTSILWDIIGIKTLYGSTGNWIVNTFGSRKTIL